MKLLFGLVIEYSELIADPLHGSVLLNLKPKDMFTTTKMGRLRNVIMLLVANFTYLALAAQDSSGGSKSVTVTKSSTQTTTQMWYTSPWVWVIGAAVFILLLIALLRGGGSSGRTDKVTYTKTVSSDPE